MQYDEEPPDTILADARAKLDRLIHFAVRRPLTDADATDVQTLEQLVARLGARLGHNPPRQLPYGAKKLQLMWPPSGRTKPS